MSIMSDYLAHHPAVHVEFKEFNYHRWIKITKGCVFYKAFIFDEDDNEIWITAFYEDFDECLEAARNWVDNDVKNHFEFLSSTLTEPRTGKEK